MGRRHLLAAAAGVAFLLCGCTASPGAPPPASSAPPAEPDCPPVRPFAPDTAFDQALHDELTAMLERDQAGRLGTGSDAEGDQARTDRLMEII